MTEGPLERRLVRGQRASGLAPHRATICLASTSGGHLAQLEAIATSLGTYDFYLVTVASAQAQSVFLGTRKHYVHRILRNPIGFVVNAAQSMGILFRERPKAVITTGAGDILPTAIGAACLGIPVVFVESMARTSKPSLFGRIVNRFAQLTVIQWPALSHSYVNAAVAAPIFRPRETRQTLPPVPEIVVLTGTHVRGFDRLLASIDEMLESNELKANVFAQIGHTGYRPRNYRYVDFLPRAELLAVVRAADLVVTHDGAGSIGDAFCEGKPVVVVPRMKVHGEVSYHTTADLAHELAKLGWVTLVANPRDLSKVIAQLRGGLTTAEVPTAPEVGAVVHHFLTTLSPTSEEPHLLAKVDSDQRRQHLEQVR